MRRLTKEQLRRMTDDDLIRWLGGQEVKMDELDVVRLIRAVEHETGVLVPAGIQGTIVSRYPAESEAVGYLLELRGHDPVTFLDVAPTDVELVQSFQDLPSAQQEIIRAALEPPAAIMTVTDDTTDEEFEAFIRGEPEAMDRSGIPVQAPKPDLDNPPIKQGAKLENWFYFLRRRRATRRLK